MFPVISFSGAPNPWSAAPASRVGTYRIGSNGNALRFKNEQGYWLAFEFNVKEKTSQSAYEGGRTRDAGNIVPLVKDDRRCLDYRGLRASRDYEKVGSR